MQIRVRVKAGSKEDSVKRLIDDRLAVSVKEKAEGGRANDRVKELLAEYFSVLPNEIKLISGHTSSSKVFVLPD